MKPGSAPFKFRGGDNEDEQVIFKSCALGAGAKGKHVVELSAVDANSEKCTIILGVLSDAVSYDFTSIFVNFENRTHGCDCRISPWNHHFY